MGREWHLQPFLEAGRLEAGCDEAGRGPLAGPVYAAAVMLPPDFHHPLLNDSKQLTQRERDTLRPIIEAEAIAWLPADRLLLPCLRAFGAPAEEPQ